MTRYFNEEETVAAVARLTRTRLATMVEQRVVQPRTSAAGPVFAQIDVTRLELACDLTDDFGLDEDALSMVLSLIDQIHGLRGDMARMLAALAEEDEAVRARIRGRLSNR